VSFSSSSAPGSSLCLRRLLALSLYVATGRFSFRVSAWGCSLLGAGFLPSHVAPLHCVWRSGSILPRSDHWSHYDPGGSGYNPQSIFAAGRGRAVRKRRFARGLITIPGPTTRCCLRRIPTRSLADRQRASALSAPAGLIGVLPDRSTARCFKDRAARRRTASRSCARPAYRGLRDPGLQSSRRRCHPVDPADRRHPAFVSYGGSASRQLRPSSPLLLLVSARARRDARRSVEPR